MKNVLILEDDSFQIQRIENLIKEVFPEINAYSAQTYSEGVEQFNEHQPFSFFIMDIDLGNNPEMKDGLDFARYIRSLPEYEFVPMIYISSVSNRLEEAFVTTHCYDFIKKPYMNETIIKSINKMLLMPEPLPPVLDVKGVNSSRLHIITKEIIYIESIGHNLIIHTADNSYLSKSESLKKVMSQLPANFVQCHKSYIVNTNHTLQYNISDKTICISGVKDRIPVGRKFREYWDNQ